MLWLRVGEGRLRREVPMYNRTGLAGVRCVIAVVLVLTLVVGCAADGRLPRVRLPRRGPVDVFLDVLDQVSRLGESIGRQFGRMTRGRR
jgi:hypothetical protein